MTNSIRALIAKFGDDDFEVRQQATEEVERLGVTAARVLMQSRDHPRPRGRPAGARLPGARREDH
jgi:hypothetical protein